MEFNKDILQLIEERRSVRQYKDIPIEKEKREILNVCAAELSEESELDIKIIYDEKTAFDSSMAHYGNFENVGNYIAIFGAPKKDEAAGYYAEHLVLKAQELGLNTCWVALTFDKSKVKPLKKEGQKLYMVIALGYGEKTSGKRKSKTIEQVTEVKGEKPDKFDEGAKACLLAPTAINQQKFLIKCKDKKVEIVKKGLGFYTEVDLGIVKCHFELVTGIKVFNG